MAIVEVYKEIVNGMGGADGNSIPVYADKNAPRGGQLYDPRGAQLMLPNGLHLVIAEPSVLSPGEVNVFATFKDDGQPYYVRCWLLDEASGHGIDIQPGNNAWVEFSHLRPYALQKAEQPLRKVLVEEISPGEWVASEVTE